jgi:tRNA-2-methylthio-N6-dimethylallyladenosine synthase
LSFITSHPKDTTPELFQAIARLDKLKKFLHLPVQSGSDRILNAMRRGYTAKYYYALAEKYRTIVPEGVLTTDIIVGYPGETVTDFRRTYELVERVRFNAAFIFKYSPRPGTAASKLADDVPQQEKERRHALVLELQRKISKSKR